MKVLSFGHIPSWAGGRQESGLANVIYQLARNIADYEDVQMSMAATDVFVPVHQDGPLTIHGWKKGMLIKYVLLNPLVSILWLAVVLNAKRKYGAVVSIPGYFFKGLHLARTTELLKPDIVHLHGMTACVYEKIIPQSIKIVVTMHGIIGEDKTIPHQSSLYKMEKEVCASSRYSLIGFIAEQLIADFTKIYGSIKAPTVAIPNAYDNKAFYLVEHKLQPKLTLVTVASLNENKGQKRVLMAIGQTGFDIRYVCIGAGAKEQITQNEAIAKQHNIDYSYVGKKSPSEIRELLAEADYMILPSSTEGFGLVYLEALACGVPVVLPQNLPIVKEKEIIQPGINAVLMENSSIDAIAQTIRVLPTLKFNHDTIASSVLNYSWTGIAKQYINAFIDLQI